MYHNLNSFGAGVEPGAIFWYNHFVSVIKTKLLDRRKEKE